VERIMLHPLAADLTRGRKLLLAAALTTAIAGPLAIGLVHAQAPAFEVASIKPADPGSNQFNLRIKPGGGLSGSNVNVRLLVKTAYHLQDSQLTGGPDWASTLGFDLDAKGGPVGSSDAARIVSRKLQTLLADRFGLKIHKETREGSIYALTIAKGGLKIKEVSRPPKEGDGNFQFGRSGITAQAGAFSDLADLLSGAVGRVVTDRTGHPGKFDFTLTWTPEGYRPPPDNPARPRNEPLPDPNGPSLFTALQEQLGLRLEATKGPVEVYVIDRVEKPSEN
jgi:uncharacterized protein (TIGR03435 family)